MATKPTDKPEFARNDVIDGTTGLNNVIAPGETKKNEGFERLEKPVYQYFNWIARFSYLWINYFETVTDSELVKKVGDTMTGALTVNTTNAIKINDTYQKGSFPYSDENWGFLFRPPVAGALGAYGFHNWDGSTLVTIEDDIVSNGMLNVKGTAESTSESTGAFIVEGGTSIKKNLTVGGAGTFGKSLVVGTATNNTINKIISLETGTTTPILALDTYGAGHSFVAIRRAGTKGYSLGVDARNNSFKISGISTGFASDLLLNIDGSTEDVTIYNNLTATGNITGDDFTQMTSPKFITLHRGVYEPDRYLGTGLWVLYDCNGASQVNTFEMKDDQGGWHDAGILFDEGQTVTIHSNGSNVKYGAIAPTGVAFNAKALRYNLQGANTNPV